MNAYTATELDEMLEQAVMEIETPTMPSMPAASTTTTTTAKIAQTTITTTTTANPRLSFSEDLQFNDVDNGDRLVQAFGEHIRYCHDQKTWFVWTGQYWMPDGEPLLQEMMKAIADELWMRSGEQSNPTLAKWACDLKSSSDIRNAISMANSEPAIAAKQRDFNQTLCLLNFSNGTLNLETMEFYAHKPSDMLTKMLDFAYDPTATCPQWDKFLNEIFPCEHAPIIPFLQAATGYSLSGITKERCLFLLHGVGRNGKSVFLDVVRSMLGDYACNASWESFIQDKHGIREDLARLAGFRFVTANESAREARLAENLIKSITGGTDKLTARHLFKSSFDFTPTFKLWLATNHKPTVSTDTAVWDRMRLIPFTVRFEEAQQDKNLAAKLKMEAAGIMNWAIAGFNSYQLAGGLPNIPEIQAATSEYRAEQDPIKSFLTAACVIDKTASVKRSDLYAAYQQWAVDNDEKVPSRTKFNKDLEAKGYRSAHKEIGYFWEGIGLTDPTDPTESL